MSSYRPPPSCCWQSLLAVPLFLFVLVFLLLHFFAPEPAHAQGLQVRGNTEVEEGGTYDHEAMAPGITAAPLSGTVDIDAVLDEAAWQSAEGFSDFVQREPDEGEP